MTTLVKLVVLLLSAYCTSAQKIPWNDLRVTFSFGDPSDGFFQLPRTVAAATDEGWTVPPEESNAQYQILCPSKDPSVCVVFSRQGDVNGIEIGMQVRDTVNSTYPFSKHPMFIRKTRFGLEVYVITMYTVKPGSTPSPRLETGDGVWMKVGPGGVKNFEIPRLAGDMALTQFTLENCIPRMGVHYYYNISPTLSCDDFEPMFALYKDGEMIGFGLQTFGRPTVLSKNWFEPVPPQAIRPTVPDAPQCLVDGVASMGIISIHVYFVEEPWNIKC